MVSGLAIYTGADLNTPKKGSFVVHFRHLVRYYRLLRLHYFFEVSRVLEMMNSVWLDFTFK